MATSFLIQDTQAAQHGQVTCGCSLSTLDSRRRENVERVVAVMALRGQWQPFVDIIERDGFAGLPPQSALIAFRDALDAGLIKTSFGTSGGRVRIMVELTGPRR